MSDTSQGPGWWRASDGRWYPPAPAPEAGSPSSPGPDRPARGVPWWMVALGAFLAIVLGAGVAFVATRDDDGDTASSDTQELVLEPLGTAGSDPFTESVATEEVAVLTSVSAPAGGDEELQVTGSQPGLYGGTQDNTACDAAALVTFLEANPDKAAAWAGALGISATGIRDYVAGLSPVLLRTDTRVTNNGFSNGVATPRQSVLQAGTAVLVDSFGMPRVRCSCGNPLTEPAPLPGQLPAATTDGDVVLVGQPWQQWNPAIVVVVNATVEVDQFVIFDIETEEEFTQPVGSDVDEPSTTAAGTIQMTATGMQIVDENGQVVEQLPFGAAIADVRAKLTAALGEPSEEKPRDPSDGCSLDKVRWGELSVFSSPSGAQGRGREDFNSWTLSQSATGVPDPSEPKMDLLGVTTDDGVKIGMTQDEFLAVLPGAGLTQGTPADTNTFADENTTSYTFYAPFGNSLYRIQPLYDCYSE